MGIAKKVAKAALSAAKEKKQAKKAVAQSNEAVMRGIANEERTPEAIAAHKKVRKQTDGGPFKGRN